MTMKKHGCNPLEHQVSRRKFLAGAAAGAGLLGFQDMLSPANAEELRRQEKRVLVIFLAGGVSQLESWDPKPGTNTGGPFRAIPTSVPGIHISELLPHTAKMMHHLALVRSIDTKENDHGKGAYMMLTGRREMPGTDYPRIGAVMSKALGTDSGLPGHISITPGGGGGRSNDAAYLGPKYASITLGNGNPPANSARPGDVSEAADAGRQAFRTKANEAFGSRRRTAQTDAYVSSYDQALDMMRRGEVFDVAKEPDADHEKYGKYDFGRHCLLARRLLEAGVTFVQVSHSNYDTHNENFDFHLEQLGEFDKPFATLVDDLAQRGMLDSTLIVVLSEFDRTPNINLYYGRDHWGSAWSVCVGGAKIARGACVGKTNDNGTAVADRQVDHANLFHTYLQAIGLASSATFDIAGRAMPMADPAAAGIKELIV